MTNRNEAACQTFSKTLGIVENTEVNKTTNGPRKEPVYGAFVEEFKKLQTAVGGVTAIGFANFLQKSAKKLMAVSAPDNDVRLANLRKAQTLLSMAAELLKEVKTSTKEVDLNAKANLITGPKSKSQRVNRNAAPDGPGPADAESLMSVDVVKGAMARHARYCKSASGTDIQGRNCPICHGVGFNAHQRIQAAKTQGSSINKAREVQMYVELS